MIARNNGRVHGGTTATGGNIRPEVDPGHSLDTAMALSLQPGVPLVVQDSVGGAQDPADVYRIDLAAGQPISVTLQGDQGDVDLLLLDAQGNVIAESANGGLNVDSLEGELAAGTYYVAVVPYDGAQTTYSVSIETGATSGGGTVIRPEVDPGHSFDSAMALPLQPGVPLVVEDQVGGAQDPADVYSFDLAAGQPINITLDGSQGDVDLHLYDAQGNLIAHSSGEGIVVENLSGELPPGTYYVAVVPWEDAQTTYSLSIQAGTTSPTAPIIPEVDPGHSFDSAMALPLQPGVPLVVQDQVGGAQDPADVYSFELTEGQPINITLDGPQGDVDLHLYDAQGNLIAHSSGEGIVIENLSGELVPGTYYVAVVPWEDAQTPYSLSIEAGTTNGGGEVVRPEVDPGHSLDTAMALPLQPGGSVMVQDQVGGAQDPADVYSFDLAQDQSISIALQGDQGDVDLLLIDAQGNVIAESINGGLEVDSLEGGLTAGSYYVAVVPYDGAETTYSLSIETGAPGAGADAAASAAMPDSLALRDQTGLGNGGAASNPFGQQRDETLAGQLLAVG